jgi:type I restriction enzyme S subunit
MLASSGEHELIPWIGDVPERWKVMKGKDLFELLSREVLASDGTVTVFRDGAVTLRSKRRLTGFTEATYFSGYQGVEPGDLVIHQMDAFAGAVGVSDSRGKCSPVCAVCSPRAMANQHYYARLIKVMAWRGWIAALSKGIRVRSTDFRFSVFKQQWLPVPPFEEQGLIVRYLDHAELRIAKAIAAKQRVLSLLQEHKLAKFETAVFGVADGEYSDAASSHPWMGDIPKHWKVVRAKSILKLLSRPVDLSSETVTCFRDGTVTKRSNRGKIGFTESIYFSGYQGVEPGDLVVHQMDAFAGAIGVSDSTGKCTPVYAICKVDASARPEFIAILLKLMARRGWVTALSRGIRVRSTDFRFPVLATQYLPLPPVEEQDAMLDSLAKATADIASAITAVSTEIALLKEYRTRLISDVVTGKLDVREEAAKLPEIDPMELAVVSVGENGDDEEATDDD